MSSAYPLYRKSIVTRSCQRCGRPLPPNKLYCKYCGYSNVPMEVNKPLWKESLTWISELEALPTRKLEEEPAHQALETPPLIKPRFPAQAFVQSAQSRRLHAEQRVDDPFLPQSPPESSDDASSRQEAFPSMKNIPYDGLYTQQNRHNFLERKRQVGLWQLLSIFLFLILVVIGSIAGYLYIVAPRMSHHMPSINRPGTTVLQPLPPMTSALFADSFRDNARGWMLRSKAGQFRVAISNGALMLENDHNKMLRELLPGAKIYRDFSLAVDAELSKGDPSNGYGIYFRASPHLATYYRLELYGDSTYAFFKGITTASGKQDGQEVMDEKLVDFTLSPLIHKAGMLNHIIIIARGSRMIFIVNGQILKMITDSGYSSGTIALFVSNRGKARPGAQASFSHLMIYPA